jgi:Fe-S-cluster containining protein
MKITRRLKTALEPHGEAGFIYAVKTIKVQMRILKHELEDLGATNAMKRLYQKIDTQYNEILKDAQISCKRGCAHCCHLNVDLTKPEAEYIISYCEENNIEIDKAKFKAQLNLTQDNRHLSKDSACPFLKNNECSIYEARPIACRTYFVMNAPERCDSKRFPNGKTKQATFIPADCMTAALDNLSESKPMQQWFAE